MTTLIGSQREASVISSGFVCGSPVVVVPSVVVPDVVEEESPPKQSCAERTEGLGSAT